MSFFDKMIELTNAKSKGGSDGFVGHCPIHNDNSPSLSIKLTEEDRPLVNCYAGCNYDDIKQFFVENNAWPTKASGDAVKTKKKRDYAKKAWDESLPIAPDNAAGTYLVQRGLKIEDLNSACYLRYHPSLYHKNEDGFVSHRPALIGKVVRNNEALGIQRIYINPEFKKLGSPKILGEFAGGVIPIGAYSFTQEIVEMHLAEGIETALAVHLIIKQLVFAVVSAGNLSKVPPPKTVKTIHFWADKDRTKAGESEAYKAAKHFKKLGIKCIIHLPKQEIPAEKKSIDYLDVYNINPDQIAEELNAGHAIEANPQKIKKPSYFLPPLTEHHLPFVIRDWVTLNAQRLSVAPEMIAVALLSVIGSMIGRALAIKPKKHDDWKVFANLWGIIIAPPGSKKTPAANCSYALLSEIEEQAAQRAAEANKANESEIIKMEMLLKSLEGKLKDVFKADPVDEEKANSISEKMAQTKAMLETLKTNGRRFKINSSTVEKIIDLITKNPQGLFVFHDEIHGLIASFDKAGREADRQLYLQAWNGDGSYSHDTISRGTQRTNGICLTIFGGTQPAIFNQYLRDIRSGASNDGFIQRFQLAIYPNFAPSPGFVDIGIPHALEEKVRKLLDDIADLEPMRHGKPAYENEPYIATLDDKAYQDFAGYMTELEGMIAKTSDEVLQGHLSKYSKLFSGLILIFHVIDNLETGLPSTEAKPHVVEMARLWCELLKAHANKMYDVESNLKAQSGFALAGKIVQGKVKSGDTLRSIYQNEWTALDDYDSVLMGVTFLEEFDWLSIEEKASGPRGGRPSQFLSFNPLLDDFIANQEWCHD